MLWSLYDECAAEPQLTNTQSNNQTHESVSDSEHILKRVGSVCVCAALYLEALHHQVWNTSICSVRHHTLPMK